MTFDSVNFWLFLLITYFYFRIFRHPLSKKLILIVASYSFYAVWDYRYAGLLLAVTVVSYLLGAKILEGHKNRKIYLWIGLGFLLAVLGVFKYWNFVATNLNTVNIGLPLLSIVLPIGISFYIFHAISFVVDCYQRKLERRPSLIDYILYLSFFPKLIAGPLSKAYEFLPQISRRMRIDKQLVWQALVLVFFGLFKKLVFANNLGPVVDQIFASYGGQSGAALLLGAYLYAVQIYCDFSGYTDIAIGVALLFGYRLPGNFNYPYLANSPSDFWKRWHISLSSWFKEYVYFPLGGNRRGAWRTYRNIFLVMLLTGIWHGASWNFVIWGLYWALLTVVYKRFNIIKIGKVPAVILMLQLTVAGWIMFRAPSWEAIKTIFARITNLATWQGWGQIYQANKLAIGLFLIFTVYNLVRLKWNIKERMIASPYHPLILSVILVGLLVILIAYPAESTQFIYFKF